VKRILVIKPSSLGDIIHGLQVAAAIKAQMPAVAIDWVARDVFAPLVRACPIVSRVHIFHRQGGWGAFGQLVRDIREANYDTVIDMQGLARSGLMTLLSGVPRRRRIGRRDAREGAGLACGVKTARPAHYPDAHAVDILREFLPALGLENTLADELPFRPPNEPIPNLPADYLLLFPGSRRNEKEWPGFAELTQALLAQDPERPVVWAGDVRMDTPPDCAPLFNLTARTPLDALPALISRARVVVGNDSGPMHLAAALGRPLVAIFGPTPPVRFGPYPLDRPTHRVVRAESGKLQPITPDVVNRHIDAILLCKKID